MPHGPLNIRAATHIATVLGWAQRCDTLTWLLDNGQLVTGTARHICTNDNGGFAGQNDDVRDCYLRITAVNGFDWFAPIPELLDRLDAGTIAATS